jgi:hypothetical protein
MKQLRGILLGTFLFWLLLWAVYAIVEGISHASSVNTTPIYNISGVEQMGDHYVIGRTTLSVGTVTITLAGKAVFTSASSYHCSITDSTGLNLTAIAYTDGSHFTITGVGLSDNVSFFCGGN